MSKAEITNWLISSNPSQFNAIDAFKELGEVDWTNPSNNRINIGDIVYIYISKPIQKIAIKTIVIKSDIGEDELLANDEEYILSDSFTADNYFRLKLIQFIDNDLLDSTHLLQNGLNAIPLGKQTIKSELLKYILDNENSTIEPLSNNAFFENGVYETVLTEIITAQEINPNITSYIQPYSSGTTVYLKEQEPTPDNPITFYISTTTNLGTVQYIGEIIGWEDKRELFVSDPNRVQVLNKHILEFQPGEKEIYKYSDDTKTKECVNLISIRNLRKLALPFSVSMLVKVSDGTPLKATRSQAGGWSEVYELDVIESPVFLDDINAELEKNIVESKLMSQGRRKRLEQASEYASEVQIVSRGFKRNADVIVEVLERANGVCEKCGCDAPFIRAKDNTPYLEVHHQIRLADGGKDNVDNAIAVCPNCHRELHFGV